MPTYTQTGLVLPANGEFDGIWGEKVNDNTQIIDRLTNGVGAIALSGTTHTLTTAQGELSPGQFAVLVFGGSPSGTNTVTINPNDAQHVYIVRNTTAQSVVLTQGSGGNVTVPAGKSAIIASDGAGAGAAVTDITAGFAFQAPSAALTDIAALSVTDGNFIVGNGTTWVAESGDTVLTSIGVTATASQVNQLNGNVFTGNLTVDTSTFFVDAANNRVGVGTTSPTSVVHVAGTSVSKFQLQSGSGVGGGFIAWHDNLGVRNKYIGTASNATDEFVIWQESAANLRLATANTERMRITDTGNVGIGNTTPTERLHVTGNILASGNVNATTLQIAGTSISGIASQADAEAGTATDKLITPLSVRNAFNATGTAPVYACRAWVNFNGTGTVAILGSGNVSSITDNGTGDYTINFTTAMTDANYAATVNGGSDAGPISRTPLVRDKSTTSCRVNTTIISSGTLTDVAIIDVAIFR